MKAAGKAIQERNVVPSFCQGPDCGCGGDEVIRGVQDHADDGVLVDESDNFLKAPNTAQAVRHDAFWRMPLASLCQLCQDSHWRMDRTKEHRQQSSHGHAAEVVPEGIRNTCAPKPGLNAHFLAIGPARREIPARGVEARCEMEDQAESLQSPEVSSKIHQDVELLQRCGAEPPNPGIHRCPIDVQRRRVDLAAGDDKAEEDQPTHGKEHLDDHLNGRQPKQRWLLPDGLRGPINAADRTAHWGKDGHGDAEEQRADSGARPANDLVEQNRMVGIPSKQLLCHLLVSAHNCQAIHGGANRRKYEQEEDAKCERAGAVSHERQISSTLKRCEDNTEHHQNGPGTSDIPCDFAQPGKGRMILRQKLGQLSGV